MSFNCQRYQPMRAEGGEAVAAVGTAIDSRSGRAIAGSGRQPVRQTVTVEALLVDVELGHRDRNGDLIVGPRRVANRDQPVVADVGVLAAAPLLISQSPSTICATSLQVADLIPIDRVGELPRCFPARHRA